MIKTLAIFANGMLSSDHLQSAKNYDYLIATDKVALKIIASNIIPQLVIGDFDSVSNQEFSLIKRKVPQIKSFSKSKDLTDLHLAVLAAIKLKPKSIDIFGATGTRLDHLLAGIYLLSLIQKKGIAARIIDNNNQVEINDKVIYLQNMDIFDYFSILPLTKTATVSISGAQYPLNLKKINLGETIGISNSLTGKSAKITIHQGKIIFIKSKD